MPRQVGERLSLFGLLYVIMAVGLIASLPANAADPQPKPFKSGIVSFDDAKVQQADWGEMRRYFTCETSGTKDVLTPVAIIKPGKTI